MISSLPRLVVAATVILALLAPAAARAQDPPELPVGEARGVRLVEERGGLVLVFTSRSGKLRQRINSRYTWFSCTELDVPFTTTGGGNLDIPRRGRRVRTGFGFDDADFCRVFLRAHTVKREDGEHRVPRRVLLSIPLTQAGAVYLDEEAKALRLLRISAKLRGQPTYAQLVEEHPDIARVVVELATPDASPPPRRVGYYSDGQEHSVVAILSASGKRLFIEQEPGDVLRTNVAGHIFGQRP